jgi:NAD(P)-dependent dehydrogenase (short-subunit alcohol dehydrogenase family)
MTKLPGETSEERDERWKALIPAGRMGHPAEISEALLWACSDRTTYFMGERLVIDGGHSL